MNRRKFMTTTGQAAAIATTAVPAFGSHLTGATPTEELLELFIKKNDLLVDKILTSQQVDKTKPFFGGFAGTYSIFPVGKAAWYTNRMVCSLVSDKSRHFQSAAVGSAILNSMEFVKSLQHDDGTIDLTSTNFHSTPDTGFVVEPIALALSLVRKYASEKHVEFQTTAESFLQAAGEALTVGGIHTPNHRWVICMALARIHELIPDRRLVFRAEQWLTEGIDIDSEGHYTEHSTSIYSPLINRCLITIARMLDRPELLEPVRKNLNLNQYLVRPNGEIVTAVSRRQDQFRISKMGNHYYSYRYMAIHDKDGSYHSMTSLIEKSVDRENLYGDLTYFLEDNNLSKPLASPVPLTTNYVRSFSKSKIVRIRRDNFDTTILANNETFLTVHKGNAALRAVRFASAFFGKGQFKSSVINESQVGSYVLEQSLRGPYYQLLPAELLPGDGDWNKMPRERRPQTEVQNLRSRITFVDGRGSLKIVFEIDGTDRVPLAIELAFDRSGEFAGVDAVDGIQDAFMISGDQFSFTNSGATLNFKGARSKHRWTQIRGALPKLDAQCVYITDFTPFKFELTIS